MGLGATVTPTGTFEMVTFTLPVKPSRGETVTVPALLAPGTTTSVAGLAAIEKPGPWDGCPPPPQEQRMAATRDRTSLRQEEFIARIHGQRCRGYRRSGLGDGDHPLLERYSIPAPSQLLVPSSVHIRRPATLLDQEARPFTHLFLPTID